MTAYAQYMRNSYDDATNAAQRFITLHPGHKDAAYAYYLVAMCQYEQIRDVKRDQSTTEKALTALDEIPCRFPGTSYARDVPRPRRCCARPPCRQGDGGWALLQSQEGLSRRHQPLQDGADPLPDHLPRAGSTLPPDGGLSGARRALRSDRAAVLGHNYPNSDWHQDAYQLLGSEGLAPQASSGSWISQIFN